MFSKHVLRIFFLPVFAIIQFVFIMIFHSTYRFIESFPEFTLADIFELMYQQLNICLPPFVEISLNFNNSSKFDNDVFCQVVTSLQNCIIPIHASMACSH